MTNLDAPIKEVTVYADRALIMRNGSLHLEAGEHEIRINNLPQFSRDSLRAAGQGPQGTRILNVDIATAFYSRPPETELLTLQNEFDLLIQNKQLLEARQGALNDRRQWLRSLGEQSRDFAKGLAKGQMKPQDCADFFSFAANQALQDAEAAQSLELQLKQVDQDIIAKKREMSQKMGDMQPDRLAAIITVVLAQAGEFELELSYLVMGASWHPQYDVRVQMASEQSSGEVELTYVGVVQQSTGENWQQVGLSLSTARPSSAAVLPELEPWYLDIYTPPPPYPIRAPYASAARALSTHREQVMMASQAKIPTAALGVADSAAEMDLQEEFLASLPAPASIATATVEQTGTALIFRAGRSVDIPSDNSPHKTTIARDNLPCTFDYVSAPAIEENAHLRATILNTTDRVLLSGNASIFLSSEYVGTTSLKTTVPTEKFKIFLGIDDDIKVKRELLERSVDKGSLLQSSIRRTTYAYRITVHNYATAPRQVIIRDHIPVSQNERIKVKVQSISLAPKERSKLELMIWEFTLAPDAEQIIEYRFIVEHPQDVTITGLS